MGLALEVWTRPGHPSFGKVIADLPATDFAYHDGVNLPGDGNASIPASYPRLDDILYIDQVTPANCVQGLVRVVDGDDIVFEWLPQSLLPTTSKTDPKVECHGAGIKSILGYARVEAWDWDGSLDFAPTFPDWVYGGRNLLGNFDFSNSPAQNAVYQLLINASGGTFAILSGANTTGAIAFNASDGVIEGALESMSPTPVIDDALVTPISGGFTIEVINPFDINNLTVSTGSLTGTATLTRTQTGALQPDPWTRSRQINVATPREYGTYVNFRVLEPTASPTGTYALWINPGPVTSNLSQFAGAQQVVNVTPGGLYQASVLVYSATGGDYRFVIRGLDEDEIARLDVTLAAATPTVVSIPDVLMETATGFQPSQVIFRFANVEPSGTPSDFYIMEGHLDEGLAPSSIGTILWDLFDDATTEHAGRVVWEDEANPGTPYLTPDFSATLDSAGNAWAHPELSVKLWMRMTYFQVMNQFASTWGYEWRIVPDDPEAGTWLWQVYNPDAMMTDRTGDPSPAIQGGSNDVRRSIRRFAPDGSNVMVEGLQRLTGRDQNAGLVSALGRIESSRLDRELPSTDAISDAAAQDMAFAVSDGITWQYSLMDPVDVPGNAYVLGDRITIHDPPLVDTGGRFADVEVAVSKDGAEFELTFIP